MATLNNGWEYSTNFPPGYRFHPHDHELITYYLKPKINNQPLPLNLMHEVFIYDHDPDELAACYQAQGEGIWYFLTKREKKYPNGGRPKRSTSKGYWKATANKKTVKNNQGEQVGVKRSLTFFVGKHGHGTKTSWTMQEYWIEDIRKTETPTNNIQNTKKPTYNNQKTKKLIVRSGSDNMELDGWVLCKVYKTKGYSSGHGDLVAEEKQQQQQVEESPARNSNHASTSYSQATNNNNNIIIQHDYQICQQQLSSQLYETSSFAQKDQQEVEKIPVEGNTNHNNNMTPQYPNFDQEITWQAIPTSISIMNPMANMQLQLPSMYDEFGFFDQHWEDFEDLSPLPTPSISSWGCFDELSAVITDMKKPNT